MDLPIEKIKDKLFCALEGGARKFVVRAPTGSGKSTRLPMMLAEKIDGRILVLQPRRVAARLLAKYVAKSAGSSAGGFAGWHIRMEKNYSPETKIVFVTEGVLARMVLSDPDLKGVGAVVFDEFHERNLFSDISFALVLKSVLSRRKDLAVFVCSASFDADEILKFLGDGAVSLECESRLYPVDIEYAPLRGQTEKIWDRAALEFERLARENPSGDFLIFMPGSYEISRTISAILKMPSSRGMEVLPLHGSLSGAMQDRAVAKSERRKVVVATNIAETSLTIDGVKFVIDSGFARVARYDFSRGVNTLYVERISHASAVQRAGRAGRTSAGIAVRLWRKNEESDFSPYLLPEILRLDLSQILLWLKVAGLEISALPLLDAPSEEKTAAALEILKELGAVDEFFNATPLGVKISRLPTEVRYGRMLIEAAGRGVLKDAAMFAAVMDVGRVKMDTANERSEFELYEMLGECASELGEISEICRLARSRNFDETFCKTYGIHAANARRVFEVSRDFFNLLKGEEKSLTSGDLNAELAKSVLSAFSDRVCARLNEGTLACAISGGRRGEVRRSSKKYASKIFAALELAEQNVGGRVSIMASGIVPLKKEWIAELFPNDFSEEESVSFDENSKRVAALKLVKFRDMVLEKSSGAPSSPDVCAKIFCDMILEGKLVLKNWSEAEENFIDRVNFVSELCPESGIAKIDEEAKRMIFEQMCLAKNSYSEIRNADVLPFLKDWLSFEQAAMLDYLAPEFANLPLRRKPVKIRYELPLKRAVVSAKFSELYDFDGRKIKILDGKMPATFEILAPNGRPVQITQNLEEFWKTSWLGIKKELKARYPKHFKD